MDRFVRSAAKAIPGFQATPAQSEAEGIRLPIPNGGLVFVIRVQPIVSVRSAAIAPPPTLETKFDPRVEYLACLRDALLDALLGESGGLPLNDAEWLTVVVTEAQKLSPEQVRGRKLYLAIKASDLSRLRRGQISTAAARMLVKVALEFD